MDSTKMVQMLIVAQAQCLEAHANYLDAQRSLRDTFEGFKSEIRATLPSGFSPVGDAVMNLDGRISRLERESNPEQVINAVAHLVVHLTSPQDN